MEEEEVWFWPWVVKQMVGDAVCQREQTIFDADHREMVEMAEKESARWLATLPCVGTCAICGAPIMKSEPSAQGAHATCYYVAGKRKIDPGALAVHMAPWRALLVRSFSLSSRERYLEAVTRVVQLALRGVDLLAS